MDTAHLEYTAEDLIAHKLQHFGILVAKPRFDRNGADLLCFLDVADAAKFCRIQCKGRSLKNTPRSSVVVPENYVTDGFVLFLYVDPGTQNHPSLFCFLGKEIRASWHVSKGNYRLSFSRSSYENQLAPYLFNSARVAEIKKAIISVDFAGEFKRVIHGYMEAQESGSGSATFSGAVFPRERGGTDA